MAAKKPTEPRAVSAKGQTVDSILLSNLRTDRAYWQAKRDRLDGRPLSDDYRVNPTKVVQRDNGGRVKRVEPMDLSDIDAMISGIDAKIARVEGADA